MKKQKKQRFGSFLVKAGVAAMMLVTIAGYSLSAFAYNGCSGGDCVGYDLSTQDNCTYETKSATFDIRWARGLSTQADQAIEGGRIVAYWIKWSSGMSIPFVPGINDVDYKFNSPGDKMRRMWSYFYDHEHAYIICKKASGAF